METEAEKNLAPGLLQTIKRFSLLAELLHDTALMRHLQRQFFKTREPSALEKAREYERRVDKIIDILWPKTEQQKLFEK